MTYIPPRVFESKFTCPHCSAIAKQSWSKRSQNFQTGVDNEHNPIRIAICDNCEKYSLWHFDTMIYPDHGTAPPGNPDTPEDVLKLYSEAASIASKSPRAAAALIRLAVQVLCKHLGQPGKNINDDIGELVKNGLPPRVQKSLDAVRVTGNNAVHPGQIDVDDPQVVASLFSLLNIIVEQMISVPKQIDSVYDALPPDALAAIQKRDGTGT